MVSHFEAIENNFYHLFFIYFPELAISPLDNSLHFIDDNVVLKLTGDGRVSIVAGRPLHCPPVRQGLDDVALATSATLVEPQSLTFAPNGDLFVAESDSQVRATENFKNTCIFLKKKYIFYFSSVSTGSARSRQTERFRRSRARTPNATAWTRLVNALSRISSWRPTSSSLP